MHAPCAGRLAINFLAINILALCPTVQAASGPAAACAVAGTSFPDSDLVLGHFRGGRIVPVSDGVPLIVWTDDYACFTARQTCEAWQRTMNSAWPHVEGDRTCLPIR